MQDQFWYPQLEGNQSNSRVVSEALNQFVLLLHNEETDIKETPLSSKGSKNLFRLNALLEKEWPEPVVVLGTCSKEKAVEYSWSQLGLNLFELPWFESEQAFEYIHVTSTLENASILKKLLSEQDDEGDRDGEVDLEMAKEQLEKAECHRFTDAVQDAFGHDERSELQGMEEEEITRRLKDGKQVWEARWENHIRDCSECGELIQAVECLSDGSHPEETEGHYARRIADLDSRRYRLAKATYLNESYSKSGWFKYVIILEDSKSFRDEIVEDIARSILGKCRELNRCEYIACKNRILDGDEDLEDLNVRIFQTGPGKKKRYLFVEKANVENSKSRKRLCDRDGKDIIYMLKTEGVREIRNVINKGKEEMMGGVKSYLDEKELDDKEYERRRSQSRRLIERFRNKEAKLSAGEVLTCFDLNLGGAAEGLSGTLLSGLWVMYGVACAYSKVPRVVITGYRSQTAMSHAAGGHGYLLKPYTTDQLETEIFDQAATQRQIFWVCPDGVRKEYTEILKDLDDTASFGENIEMLLDHRFREQRIRLSLTDEIQSRLTQADLIILDPYRIDDTPDSAERLTKLLRELRTHNSRAPVLVVLPFQTSTSEAEVCWRIEDVVADYYRDTTLRLQEGSDAIIHKPFWISADGHRNPRVGFANQIEALLEKQDKFDIKYQILVPVAAILGRCGTRIRGMRNQMHEEKNNLDQVFAPFLPFLVRAYGLSASLRDLKAIESVRLAHDLHQQIQRDKEQNDWSGVEVDTVNEVVTYFAETAISTPAIQQHVTLESWMRKRVDRRAREEYEEELRDSNDRDRKRDRGEFEDMSPLTRPLSLVFGGSTRYEFSVRGSWYKNANERVDDILIVVEFAARSSIVARSIIEDLAVHYLSKVAGEEEVMVQEISTDAHVWSDS